MMITVTKESGVKKADAAFVEKEIRAIGAFFGDEDNEAYAAPNMLVNAHVCVCWRLFFFVLSAYY